MPASARTAVGRQFLVAGLALLVALALGGAVLIGGVSFGLVDRPILATSAVFALTLLRAVRTAYRVRREGPEAASSKPPPPGVAAERDGALDAVNAFLLVERFKLVGDRYELSTLADDGRSVGEPVARIDRAAFQARERLEAFSPDGRTVFVIQAQQVLDLGGRYVITGDRWARLGELRKNFTTSLVRSTWEIWDGNGTLVATAQERSIVLALVRRFVDALPLPIPYQFEVRALDGTPLGTFRRLRTLRDRYVLDLSGDTDRQIDRRLALALAVALDALQGR